MDYLALAKDIVEKAGAPNRETETFILTGTETQIQVMQGEVEKLSQSGSKGLGVRVIAEGGHVGYAYTSDFTEEGIAETWQRAVATAEAVDADENRILPDPQPYEDPKNLAIFDPTLVELTTQGKIDIAKRVERAALDHDPRIAITDRCTYADTIAAIYLANSRGFTGQYKRTTAFAYIFAMARDEDGTLARGIGLGGGVKLADLDPEAIGREAAERAIQQLGAEPVETQIASVVMDPIVTAEFLAYLSMALTAEAMQRKRSFLLDKMGQDVAADRVSLIDDGRLPGGMASAPFDGEGVPTRATRLIDEGVLQAVIYDSYTARIDGTQSTGNAQRGSHRSKPGLGPSNLYLQSGNQSPEEIIAGVEKGLYITNSMSVGGINPINGDYSVGASGMWIENGKLTKPVKEVTVAINMNDLLKNITAVGDDLRIVPFYGSVGAPTIRVEGVTIGGQ